MKALLIVNPSSGGNRPKNMSSWQKKSCGKLSEVVVKHTEKKEMPHVLPLKRQQILTVSLQWAVMVPSMKRSMA